MESSVKSLIEAEEEAKRIVSQAEREKLEKIRDAATMAAQVLNRKKQEREKKYQEEIAQKEKELGALKEQDAVVAKEMEQIKQEFESNKASVIDMLLAKITQVSLEVPKVVIQQFDDFMK